MCNYSLKFSQTRKAIIGEALMVRRTSDPDEPSYLIGRDDIVVCLQRGTELVFDGPVDVMGISFKLAPPKSTLATFTKGDMLHFACGRQNHTGWLAPGQTVKVLQLPVERAMCEELDLMLSRRKNSLQTTARSPLDAGGWMLHSNSRR
jgi:hypothetical protein